MERFYIRVLVNLFSWILVKHIDLSPAECCNIIVYTNNLFFLSFLFFTQFRIVQPFWPRLLKFECSYISSVIIPFLAQMHYSAVSAVFSHALFKNEISFSNSIRKQQSENLSMYLDLNKIENYLSGSYMKLIGPEANLNHVPCLGWSAPITPNVCVNLILQSARCRKAVKHGVKKDFSRLYVLRLGLCVVICERLRALDKSSCESWNEVPLCLTCRPRSRIWCMKRRAEEPRCPSASWSQTLTGYELTLVLCSLSSPSFFFFLSRCFFQ